MSLVLPIHLPVAWDWRLHNAVAFIGIREATGAQLTAAMRHERNIDARQALGTLLIAFNAAGGEPGAALSSVLRFPRRPAAGQGPKPTTLRLDVGVDAA